MGQHAQHRALVAALFLALAPPAAAAPCRLALALGIDVSRSVDARDCAIQRDGLAAALSDPRVRRAMFAPGGEVRLAIFEWSGKDRQDIVLPWTALTTAADADRVVARVRAHQRAEVSLPTGLGAALEFGHALLLAQPDCPQRTLDISGDGQSNDGPTPEAVYARDGFEGVLVNGLPIGAHESDITAYYQTRVIRGPGAFVVPAPTQADYPAALRHKLERELTARLVGEEAAAAAPG